MSSVDVPSQKEVLEWAASTFGDLALDTNERALRFVEEAIELAQACGLTEDQLRRVAYRVYSRNPGSPHKETGQAAMTLLALSEWMKIDFDDALIREWRRVQSIPQAEWERRHNAKAAVGIATPMTTPPLNKPDRS